MKYSQLLRKFIIINLAVSFLSGCSEVDFAPDDASRAMSGQLITETFTQDYANKKLDVLVVVDNSGSMADDQVKLGDRINSFLSSLNDIDWQLGVTTTDVSDGTYGIKGSLLDLTGASGKILRPTTPDVLNVFKSTVVRPESVTCTTDCPSGREQPLLASIMAMDKRNSVNSGFFRTDSDLGILILSDEDELSIGGPDATDAADVINKVSSIWGESKDIFSFGIVIRPMDTACYNKQGGLGNYANVIDSFARATGGQTGSICDADYGPTLGSLGNNVRQLIGYVQLKGKPVASTLQISYIPTHTTTWSVKGKRIYFDVPPPKGTVIGITYTAQ
jgi:hypothetical protein